MRPVLTKWGVIAGLWLLAFFALAACGSGSDSTESASGPSGRVVPTMPAARFAQPTTMIGAGASASEADTAEAEADTVEADAAEIEDGEADAAETPAAPTPAPPTPEVDLARGENLFQTRGCADCHGEQAEGIPGEGSALAGLELTESQFSTILRTGGSGRLGSEHLFGPSVLSPGGVTVMHAWLQSLDDE